jgi:hypothetical protein
MVGRRLHDVSQTTDARHHFGGVVGAAR